MTDPYAGIFDHLDPADFMATPTADSSTAGEFVGEDAFGAFINDQVAALNLAWATSGGTLRPFAVLCSPTVKQLFVPELTESLREFFARVTEDARRIRAHWVFFELKTYVSPLPPGEHLPADSPQAVALADNLQEKVIWYAEARDIGINRVGVMTIDDDGKLSPAFDVVYDQAIESVSGILGDQ